MTQLTLAKTEKLKAELVSSYLHDDFSFEDLCNAIKHDILLADAVLLPLSYPLSAHQKATMLEYEEGKFIFQQACRGAAKSSTVARYCLLKALTWPTSIIFTAPTFRQALLAFKYLQGYLYENSTARNAIRLISEVDGKITGGGGQSVEARARFKNTSLVKALPMGQGEKLRGERADILVCDEFFNMEKELFKTHILPFLYKPVMASTRYKLERPEAKLVMLTSAEYEDCYAYHFLTHTMLPAVVKQNNNPEMRRKYVIIDWNIDDLTACGFPLEPDIVELQTGNASKEEKLRALYNKWIGISGQFFPVNVAESIKTPDVQIEHEASIGYNYALTVDVAISEKGDYFIIHVWKFLGDRKMALVNSYWAKGQSPDDMAYYIQEFNKKFRPEYIYMDKGGGGLAVTSSLAKRKLILSDGREVPVESPILLHDELMLVGQKKLILNRPSDRKVRQALMGNRPTGEVEVSHEEQVLHLTYEGIKRLITTDQPLVVIPEFATGGTDSFYRSEFDIMDNIVDSVHQLRHLAVKTIELADGQKEVVRSPRAKVPYYIWKGSPHDAAVTFAYGYVPYCLYYADALGEEDTGPDIIIEENLFEAEWMRPYLQNEGW